MEVPDKIYMPNKPEVVSGAYSSRTAGNDVEYLRKDALLEWAKKQEEKLTSDSFTSFGKRKMLKRLIDKIESL